MLIRYLSDLHLEFFKPKLIAKFIEQIPLPTPDEVCVLAGDIGIIHSAKESYNIFIKFISNNFKKTFVICGNHEYYSSRHNMEKTKCEIYENYCFIGSTMWSNITDFRYKINDVKNIPNFDCIKYNETNKICVDFLKDSISKNDNCIVITHHMPSESLIHPKYKTMDIQLYNKWFYCDMDDVIKNNNEKIKVWIYGHTHTPSSVLIHGVPIVCNPIGYPKENMYNDFNKIITLNT
jgi:predicted MPP superfamily phosphohydrolase